MYRFDSKEELIAFIVENVLTTDEVTKILNCTRQNITDLIRRGKITPIKKTKAVNLFWRDDVEERKSALQTSST